MEGEVQARDVVIATLKCERVKRLLADNKYSLNSGHPFSALKRDSFATFVNSSDCKVWDFFMFMNEQHSICYQLYFLMYKCIMLCFVPYVKTGGYRTGQVMGESKTIFRKSCSKTKTSHETYA